MAYLYDLTDTWNAAGTVFNAIKMNVTNTASAAGSKIVSLQVGATDRFTVDKDGNGYFSGTLQAVGSISSPNAYISGNSGTIGMQDNTASILAYNATGSGGITNTLRFITGAAERVRIDASGNVGIGTTPSYKLDVSATGNISGQFKTSGSINALYLADAGTTAGTLYIGTVGNDFRVVTGSNEQVRVTSAGNLGIGTSSPGYKLDVAGTAANTISGVRDTTGYALFRAANTGNITFLGADTSTGAVSGAAYASLVWGNSNQPMLFGTNNTERARIDSSGNVGIGTTAPSNQLSVGGNNTATISLDWTGDNAAKAWFSANHSTGEVRHAAVTNYFPTFYSNNNERMRIDLSGNVGIGTSSPNNKLDVNGSVNIGAALITGNGVSTGDCQIELGGNRTGSGNAFIDLHATAGTDLESRIIRYGGANGGMDIINMGTGGMVISQEGAAPMVFKTTATERARIDSSGNLMVGTTSSYTASKSAFYETTASYWPIATRGNNRGIVVDVTDTSGVAMYFTTSSGANFAGQITISGTSTTYATSSDARLKHDIVDAPEASSLIDAIKVRSFKWNANNSDQRYGFIAQELLEVAPEAVSVPADEDQMMGVDYSKLVPMLVKEIQSLRARVAQLEGN